MLELLVATVFVTVYVQPTLVPFTCNRLWYCKSATVFDTVYTHRLRATFLVPLTCNRFLCNLRANVLVPRTCIFYRLLATVFGPVFGQRFWYCLRAKILVVYVCVCTMCVGASSVPDGS